MALTNETSKLYLNLSAADMAQELIKADAPVNYWSTKTDSENHKSEETPETIYKASLTGGDQGTKYHCTSKFKITVTGIDETESVQEADGELKLSVENTSGVEVKFSTSGTFETGTTNFEQNLNSLVSEPTNIWVSYDFTRTNTEQTPDTAEIKAALRISNTKDEQNYLAGKTITLTIEPDETDNFKCNIVQPEA